MKPRLRPTPIQRLHGAALLVAGSFGLALPCPAQVSLSTAVNLALRNSPKVKLAQADVDKAQAVLSQSRDAFVPAVAATGGVGKSTGAPLNPPVVFSIAAQSLVFNSSQRDYIRAAHAGLDSARMALDATRSDVVEDVTNTYVALDNALRRRAVETEALGYAGRLMTVAEDRFNAGVDPHIDLTRARHTEAEIRLQQLTVDDEVANQSEHLAQLTGLSAQGLTTDHSTIPVMQVPLTEGGGQVQDPHQLIGISAAFSAAEAKRFTAHGQKHYLLRPQVAFNANYSRISTAFTTYTQYYPYYAHEGNSFNSLSFGVEITVPILDMVHRAKYREAQADAARSLYEAQSQQLQFTEGRSKLRHSAVELNARTRLAQLDRDLAQDQLDAILVRLEANAGASPGEQLTPKDEQNARLQERLKTLDMLNAELQLQQAEVSLMRQEGSLSNWLAATIPSATAAPADASPVPNVPLPPTIGAPREGATPPGASTPPTAPTVGTPPAVLPSAPVTNPAPENPPSTSPTTPSGPPHP